MNTILITGTAKTIPVKLSPIGTAFKVQYDVYVWGSKEGEQIQFVMNGINTLCGYGDLWDFAKHQATEYFKDAKFKDGAYTQYLDHLIII